MTMKRLILLASSFVCLTASCAVYDVRDFGAKGDGANKDTAALQKAIDAAYDAGGGTVRIGAGTFLSGSIFLKSNVDFFLDRGATLKGSPDREDYNSVDVCVQNSSSKAESSSGAHLVLCIEQTNVTVRGYGRIDGNSGAFLAGPDGKNWPGGQSAIPWRPSQMLYFVESDRVRMEGVSLIDAPYWSCFFHGCTHVIARNLLVRTRREPVHTHNGDGIDIDSCEDVEVSNCDIDTADDCITLRANTTRLKNKRPCAHVRVSNCRLSSSCNAVRLGVGDGTIHDAVLKNLEIYDTRTAVDVVSSWRKGGKGVDFSDILFDGMKVDCRVFCRIYHRYAKTATFKGLKFANVNGTTLLPAWVTGRRSDPIEEVSFENVNLPNGISAFNVTRLNINGGTLTRNEISTERQKDYNKRIDEADDFPGRVKIGGIIRGAKAFGGAVKMPLRGLCAHQGDRQFFPGNTAEALLSAARKGAAMVEFDVQRCKTGEFVLMHDGTIEKLTTGTGRIREHSLEELKSFTIRRFKEKGYRIPTFDEALDVLPDGGMLINVHCYAGRDAIGDIARHLKARGRLHQAFVCSGLKDIAEARKAVPEIVANNIERPGPRNRDWTPAECAKFVADSKKNKCQYLQLCRPWEREYSDDAHAAGVKVIHFMSDEPAQLKDLFERGIDFVMTNHLEPMNAAFAELGMDQYEANAKDEDPIAYIAHQGEEALAPNHSKPAYRLAVEHKLDYLKLDLRETKDGHVVLQHDSTLKAMMKWDVRISDYTLAEIRERGRYRPRGGYTNETIVTLPEALEIAKGMKKGVWFDFKHYTPAFAEKVFRIADEAGYASDRIIVATFTKEALRWVQKNRPAVRRVAHTFIRKVKGGFQMNAGEEHKVYPSVDAVAEGLERHARDYGLYGFNVPHIFRNRRQLYHAPASLVKRLHDAGYWISIWFAYDAGTGEYYREAGADAFVTNCKARTFPESVPEKKKWVSLMRFMARTQLAIQDAGSKRRNEALYFCTWEPELAVEAILKSGKWPNDCKGVIDILENASWTMPEDREPK